MFKNVELYLSGFLPNTQEAHAVAAHLPVGLSVFGVVLVVAAVAVRTERHVLRWVACAAYLLLAASAYIAVETGEDARREVAGTVPGAIWAVLDDHESMAEYVWMFGIGTAALMASSVIAKGASRRFAGIAAVVAALAAAGWVGLTGHHGGTLVYQHGIGIPFDQAVEWRINPPETDRAAPELSEEEKAVREEDLITISDIDPAEAEEISYLRDVAPLMEEVCVECHREGDLDSEYDMTTAANIIKGGEKYGVAVIPGKPDESTLIQYVRGALLPQMPEDEMPLLREEVHMLRLWIYAGAKDDSLAAGG